MRQMATCGLCREGRRTVRRELAILCALYAGQPSWLTLGAQAPEPGALELLFRESPGVFFEEYPTWAQVSSDGRWAIYSGWTGVRMLDLSAGREASERIWPGVSDLRSAAWGPHDTLMLYGTRDGTRGWYAPDRAGPRPLPLPRGAAPLWSPDGALVAYSLEDKPDSIYVGPLGRGRAFPVAGGAITGTAWLPDGKALLVLARQNRGTSNLVQFDVPSGAARVVAADLDAPPEPPSPMAVAADGGEVYVGLASAGNPDPESRHQPYANRRLGIYAIDLASGVRRLVVPPPAAGDAMAPSVGGGSLIWTRTSTDASIVVLPAEGGGAQLVIRGALVPSWRPDGRQIGFCYGDWRWADWAIAWDGGAVDVDPRGRPQGGLQPIITGFHEDFQPVWSPRGDWVAYHSHRPRTPAPYYDAPGATDDTWLRPAGVPARYPAETRLTDFGWEAGPPDWSRDGSRLVFTSYDRAGAPGVSQAFVVTIDTATGRPLAHGRLTMPASIHNAMSAVWSPVSDEVALEEDLGGGRHALWIVAADGKHARKVTEFAMATYGGLSWTRDGKALVYPALTGGRMQLFHIGTAGGVPRQLSHDRANLFEPAVSPDGRLIAATRIAHTKEVWRMRLPGH
jgi:Tol biopolymer transport system component